MPYKIKECAGRPYRPSNGSEGLDFMYHFCENCKRDQKYQETQDGADGCPIILASMCYEIEDPEYPKEWTHDNEGIPTCTAFEPVAETREP